MSFRLHSKKAEKALPPPGGDGIRARGFEGGSLLSKVLPLHLLVRGRGGFALPGLVPLFGVLNLRVQHKSTKKALADETVAA